MTSYPISHALVLPDKDFEKWLDAARAYMNTFPRVSVIRSPAGNDLNRFRNVSAVQTPRVWFNEDALLHIRRAYPMVVRVDIITASTPAQLATALQTRITNGDRYGEKQTSPKHIFDRFVLEWPSPTRPARIVRPFSSPTDTNPDTHEGIDISTFPGAVITVSAAGTVTKVTPTGDSLNYGAYVQVTTPLEGKTYITTYARLANIAVNINQAVKIGDKLGTAAGETLKLVVQTPTSGLSGFNLPYIADPTPMIYWQGIRVRPNVGILRVRSLPGMHGDIVGTVTSSDLLESDEMHGRTLAKLGVENKWLRINQPGVENAYCAAWYLDGCGLYDPAGAISGINIPGMNLDINHHLGAPDAAPLKNLGWVRLLFNVSLNPNYPEGDPRRYGNQDVDFAYNRYLPHIQRYVAAGNKVILIFTHQTFGEGRGDLGYFWPTMSSDQWKDLSNRLGAMAKQIAAKFAGKNLVYAYQIWNEQDTLPQDARAAVPIPAADYAYMLTQCIQAIRSADSKAKIITGGHITGKVEYAKQTLAAMPSTVRPDGIAFHPYGRGPVGNRFSIFGTISDAVEQYGRIMPGNPLWITEWGVLGWQHDESIAGQVSQYATGFLNVLKTECPGKVACACWYAWADSMDDGYGLVNTNSQPKSPLYETYLKG